MSARTRRSLTLLWTALFLCSLALQSVQLAVPASTLAVHDPTVGLFELDGNVENQAAAGDDWNAVFGGSDSAFETLFMSDPVNGAPDKWFTGGDTTKDISNISSWLWTDDGGQPQDKNDISHAFAAAYDHDGDLIVYFGLDRYASNGAAQVGFWFVQDDVALGNEPNFVGSHQVGDVLVQIDFENGGASPVLRVYEWVGSGGDTSGTLQLRSSGGSCATAPAGDLRCGIASTSATDPAWDFDDKFDAGANDDIPVGGLVEGGINLTDLGLDDGCFASFIAETRSSPSPTSTLSDFALGEFSLCKAPDIETQVKNDQGQGAGLVTINVGESVTDTVVVGGSKGAAEGTVDFFVCGPTNSAQDCNSGGAAAGSDIALSSGEAESDVFTPTARPTVGQPDFYCFRVSYTPALGSKYLAGQHTNDTTECVKVIPADVQIVKTPNDGSANAGENISFTLSWTNEGQGAAKGVVVSDTLPSGAGLDWSISDSSGTGSTCLISASDVVTCNVGTIAGNPNFPNAAPVNGTVTLTSATTAASCGAIDNTGQITSTNDGTDTDPGKITVDCPDVNVVKTPNNGQVNAGDPASFSIVVTNAGPGTATTVSLSDPLPAALTWALGTVTGDTDGVACQITGLPGVQTLSCSDPSMTDDQSFTVTVTTTTSSAQCATYPNVATVDATNEPNTTAYTDDNTDPGAITVNCPDVQARKTADASPVNAGDQIGFTVTIKNNGSGTAYGATGSDTLPAGIGWSIDGPANGWSIDDGVLKFGPTDLAAGASAIVHIIGTTDAADCGLVPNTVTVDASNESNDPTIIDDNSASANVTVNCPNLVVDKQAEDGSISAGEVAAFSIDITNIGAGTAYDVSLTDTLPAGVAWHLDAVAFNGVDVADPDTLCTIDGTSLTCPDLGSLAPQSVISIAISGDTDLDDCGTLLNTVTVDASNEANDPAFTVGNSDTATVDVDCPALAIDKDADHVDPVLIGDPIGFTITIKNNGAGTAFGVTVSDTLDSDFSWSIATPASGWSLVGNVLSFSGSLASGASSSVHVVAPTTIGDANDCGLVPNTAVLDHSSIDPTPASASETVQCPEIDIRKAADDDLVEPNQTVTFTLKVKVVDGPVTDAVITDDLPVGQTFVVGSASPSQPIVSPDGRTLTWTFPTLATGDPSVTITYDVTIDANTSGATQTNTAEICVSELPACDSDVEDVTPQFPDITIVKTAGDAADGAVFQTEAGPVTYTYVVTNSGPLALFSVVVTDDAGTPGNTADDFTATCPRATLAVGASMTCTFSIGVLVDTHNIAVVRGVTAGGNPVDDADDAQVVIQEFGLVIDKSNDAPRLAADLPTAKEGSTVTYTLRYTLLGDPVSNGVITDVLPVGVTYIAGSATGDAQFTFGSLSTTSRTLTWTAANVSANGMVTYKARVDVGAAELPQPLVNVAVIDSTETEPDADESDVYVPGPVAAATGTPRITLPPTDTLSVASPPAPTNPGSALMVALLAIAALVLVLGLVTPVPASVRERRR